MYTFSFNFNKRNYHDSKFILPQSHLMTFLTNYNTHTESPSHLYLQTHTHTLTVSHLRLHRHAQKNIHKLKIKNI